MSHVDGAGHTTEWLDDARQHLRCPDTKTALLHWGDDEQLVKTHDFSVGGAAIASLAGGPPTRRDVRLLVVYDSGVREFPGELVYARSQVGGYRMGLRWRQLESDQLHFLRHRYPAAANGLGKVK